jgi:ribosomal protein S18 acetylase RimI-like enzyme
MLRLRPMTEADFTAWRSGAVEAYAQERARNLDSPLEAERAVAERQIAELLKDGVRTEGHHLWQVVLDTGAAAEVVGLLWVAIDAARRRAFIYSIEIAPAHRGRGYGRQTLELLEAELRPRGVERIGLNVFAENQVAMRLYLRQGYRVTNSSMVKRL